MTQSEVFEYIKENGASSYNELSNALGKSIPAIQDNMRALSKRGLVKKVEDTDRHTWPPEPAKYGLVRDVERHLYLNHSQKDVGDDSLQHHWENNSLNEREVKDWFKKAFSDKKGIVNMNPSKDRLKETDLASSNQKGDQDSSS